MSEWTDGDFELEMETKFTINFQEIRDKLYYQVYLTADKKGEHNLEPYLSAEDRVWIETNIIEKLDEIEKERGII